ncbi:peptidoglycan DD-metalloendopeptidase family protein [Desulfobulbus rhabdoformis]|uniref:peptidoglycan DD-metalloendopeptidase family protein n=1 Tax=Desulfobulbus rhabdoformis TaxID=34032 RepID=UPI001965E858|nr:peptidoglycan DD-metalloendopeptidase family protein [Desulfobulbus rhabdoformis]MBM9614199.1 peptidoglycan DD-metalloendopeptidase family protein [Desulfobulbus rhabdoformis]
MSTQIRLRGSSRKRGGFFKMFFAALLTAALLAGGFAAFLLFEFEQPTLTLDKEVKYLGTTMQLPLQAADSKSGIQELNVSLQQGESTVTVLERHFPRKAWFKPAGPQLLNEKVLIDAQKAGIRQGAAQLVITVRDFSLSGMLKGNETVRRIPVIMDTVPPRVGLVHGQRVIKPGSTGLVVYTVGEMPTRQGVLIDSTFFPGYPTGKKDTYVAYFALPWNAQPPSGTRVVAYDAAGNEGTVSFSPTFTAVPERHDTIRLSDGFFKKKIPEFAQHYPQMQGSLLNQYLFVNNQVRKQNNQVIARICGQTDPVQYWSDRFLRMPGAGRAGFADQRTYVYNGQAVDYQTHLGMDIASVAKAEIRAANRGKVIFADYLGIYGNMIIIDHGQGVASLYSHLSSIETSVGALVKKDQPIAHSGATGMAGGDHLHFSMLIHGIFVNPLEWWDQRWITINITSALDES